MLWFHNGYCTLWGPKPVCKYNHNAHIYVRHWIRKNCKVFTGIFSDKKTINCTTFYTKDWLLVSWKLKRKSWNCFSVIKLNNFTPLFYFCFLFSRMVLWGTQWKKIFLNYILNYEMKMNLDVALEMFNCKAFCVQNFYVIYN